MFNPDNRMKQKEKWKYYLLLKNAKMKQRIKVNKWIYGYVIGNK